MLITKEHQESWVNSYIKEKHTADECSGFIDGVNKALEYVKLKLDESPAPVSQPNGDEVVKMMDEFKEENLSDRCFSVYGIRKLLNLLLGEEISMSRFVELLNERASRQPEIDALKKRVEELEDELHKIKHPF